jgi:TnpA family transposase
MLRYMADPELRQQVRTQLNCGEARHNLMRSLFVADHGVCRAGDSSQRRNRARCLSLLFHAVLVSHTLRIACVLA